MLIKLVPGNSAGTVTTFYLSSVGNYHDETHFEFLGSSSGQPYIMHTNIFLQGKANMEQEFNFWFDPTVDFHNYTIHWNPNAVVCYVDSIPIMVFRNYRSEGIGGGLVKIDWTCVPTPTPANWWTSNVYKKLSSNQQVFQIKFAKIGVGNPYGSYFTDIYWWINWEMWLKHISDQNRVRRTFKVHGGKGEKKHRQIHLGGSAQQVALAKQRVDEYIYTQMMQETSGQQSMVDESE
ncbi:unnamed protein product [Lactuca virosa]|uniref:GH16 domain-containing protein n=1 Tax=Lactuca virosa TaxID=75947 RepID=A0AAU9NUP3_9ASTR|nr:unnamed protein product [Lactuca virosa]